MFYLVDIQWVLDWKSTMLIGSPIVTYLTIRLRAQVFYKQIVNEAQPSWLSLVENEDE